ncbi:MAG: hypothetical protein JWM88_1096 [Verrucomicrobia bacterium]|nr:hypothetical protein [Verrucomicrobiota bacterium]
MKPILLLSLVLSACALAAPDRAATVDGPVSLIITYRSKPESRVAFRTWLENKGCAQFERWQHEDVFSGSRIFFTSFAATDTVDAIVILDFRHYSDSERWKTVEKRFPGGLSAEALALAAAESTSYAEILGRERTPAHDARRSPCLIAFYQLVTDVDHYRKYFEGYTVPQMRGWIAEGSLSGYAMYLNQAPLGKSWDALLFLDYTDMPGLARRDSVKAGVRAALAKSNPAWAEWSKDKAAIRRELSLVIAECLDDSNARERDSARFQVEDSRRKNGN